MDEQIVALARLRLNDLPGEAIAANATPRVEAGPRDRPLMTVPELAEFFGKAPQAIYKMLERHQIAGVTRVGRRLYVRRADLLRSLAEGRVPSPPRSG